MPDSRVCSRSSTVTGRGDPWLPLVPGRHRPDHVPGGEVEGPHRRVLAVLDLDDDAGALRVLAGRVELDAAPWHDEVRARDVGLLERLLDGLGLRGSGAVDGVGEGEDPREGARR